MAKPDGPSVDAYIASQPEASRSILQRVRTAIRTAVPSVEEGISYRIPAYKLDGRAMLYFAGWKRHYSLYPVTAALLAAFQGELAPHKIHKGTLRFSLSQPVPATLIGRIAQFRAKEVSWRAAGKAGTPK
jgi:uncharacterized protein YdhG (YjbR/CyaY superfamily)